MIAAAVSSCGTHSIEPPATPVHSFPQTFSQISISYQNIPTHWQEGTYSWNPYGSNTGGDAGNELLTFTSNYSFSASDFHEQNDTTSASGFQWVLGSGGDTLSELQLSGGGPSVPNPDGKYEWPALYENQLTLKLRHLVFNADSMNRYIVSLAGSSLNETLQNLEIQKGASEESEMFGETDTLIDLYTGSPTDSSSITITFTP